MPLWKRPRPTESITISLTNQYMEHVTSHHDEDLVIIVEINNFDMKRILVDSGSSTYVLFLDALFSMRKIKKNFNKVDLPFIGFAGRTTYAIGVINVPMVLGEDWKTRRIEVFFLVVNAPKFYNVILGYTTLKPNKIVASMCHKKMKFSPPLRIWEIKGDQPTSTQCYVNALRHRNHKENCLFRKM